MALASRILSILLGIAVMALMLWPINIPLGFGQAWWAKDIAASRKLPEPQTEPPASSLIAGTQPPTANQPPTQAEPSVQAPSDQTAARPAPAPEAGDGKKVAALKKDKAAPEAPSPPTKLYYKVHVIDAGTIQSGAIVITLADISARDVKATCKDAKGRAWRCGEAGRVALMRLIRTRAVSCTLPQAGEQKTFTARCSVGETDLSTWLVRQGWVNARDNPDKALADAEDAAKKDKAGIWRGAN